MTHEERGIAYKVNSIMLTAVQTSIDPAHDAAIDANSDVEEKHIEDAGIHILAAIECLRRAALAASDQNSVARIAAKLRQRNADVDQRERLHRQLNASIERIVAEKKAVDLGEFAVPGVRDWPKP